jgi:hypothetical protein
MPLILGTNSIKAAGGYDVANSLRFESSSTDHLSRSKSSSETSTTIGTFSFWVKRCETGATTSIYSNEVEDGNNRGFIVFDNTDSFYVQDDNSGGAADTLLVTTQKFRDLSAWSHLVVAFDTNQGTASNRCKIYHNGSQITSFSTETYATLNENLKILEGGQTNKELVGKIFGADNSRMYLAEFHHIDGQALDPTSFGEFDEDSGIWKPIEYDGTYGNNGFYLDFEDSAALGDDVSGNGNDFTVNNLTAIDQSTDTCTNNFATWNPLWSQSNGNIGDVIFSEGNLKTTTSANYRTFPATIGFSSGKWYWEIKRYEDTADMHTGVMSELATPANTATWIGSTNNGWVFGCDGGSTYGDGVEGNTGYTAAPDAGDIVQVAFNADDGKIYFGVNGTWQNSGNPATGTNPAYTGLDTSLFYFPCASTGSDVEANFGSPSFTISSGNTDGNGYGNFEYAVPSGYYSLNTKNLAEYG